MGCGRSGPVIINAIALCIALGNISDLKVSDVARVIMFVLTDELATHGLVVRGYRGTQDKHKDLKVLEALDFLTSACHPKFPLR